MVNQSLVPDPTIRQPGFDLPWHTWSMLNRFRTGRGTCRADLHQWHLSTSESCSCGQKQTMSHIVDSCPLSRFEGGLQELHTADDRAVHWLETAAKKALAKLKNCKCLHDLCAQPCRLLSNYSDLLLLVHQNWVNMMEIVGECGWGGCTFLLCTQFPFSTPLSIHDSNSKQ